MGGFNDFDILPDRKTGNNYNHLKTQGKRHVLDYITGKV